MKCCRRSQMVSFFSSFRVDFISHIFFKIWLTGSLTMQERISFGFFLAIVWRFCHVFKIIFLNINLYGIEIWQSKHKISVYCDSSNTLLFFSVVPGWLVIKLWNSIVALNDPVYSPGGGWWDFYQTLGTSKNCCFSSKLMSLWCIHVQFFSFGEILEESHALFYKVS